MQPVLTGTLKSIMFVNIGNPVTSTYLFVPLFVFFLSLLVRTMDMPGINKVRYI